MRILLRGPRGLQSIPNRRPDKVIRVLFVAPEETPRPVKRTPDFADSNGPRRIVGPLGNVDVPFAFPIAHFFFNDLLNLLGFRSILLAS
jgi:hypothetical protein